MLTRSEIRLKSLRIEAFRGFRDPGSFDLDASAVILGGPNGTGKTSVFDALQWVLLGSLERLEILRARRTVEHIVNSYRLGDRASVTLVLKIDDDEVTLCRRGDRSGSTLEVNGVAERALFADAAETWLRHTLMPHQPDEFASTLMASGLLQQDVMRSILEAKPSERFAHISAVLGLRDLELFQEAVDDAVKHATEQRRQADQKLADAIRSSEATGSKLEEVVTRVTQRASVDVARTAIADALARLPDGLTTDAEAVFDDLDPMALAGISRHLSQEVADLRAGSLRLRREQSELAPVPSPELLDELGRSGHEAEEELARAEAAVQRTSAVLSAAEKSAEQTTRLAASAIPLLSETCPVCQQPIDAQAVEAHLTELVDDRSQLIRARQALDMATAEYRAAESRSQNLSRELIAGKQLWHSWQLMSERAESLSIRLARLAASPCEPFSVQLTSMDDIEQLGPEICARLDILALACERYADTVREALTTGDLAIARSELKDRESLVKARRTRAEQAQARASQLKQLAEATTRARLDVTAQRFDAIEPLVRDIYSRLDPHPAFTMLGFTHDMYYGKGTSTAIVTDEGAGVDADPLIVFSASQANIASLSYFLAMSLSAGQHALPFVLLDDPLQSMDDINVLGFADLCRFLRSERQLIVSTHDRRFANLLRRKLAPRHRSDQTLIHTFRSWDRRGPSVQTERLSYDEDNSRLRLLSSVA